MVQFDWEGVSHPWEECIPLGYYYLGVVKIGGSLGDSKPLDYQDCVI